jgi:hypothetical protein
MINRQAKQEHVTIHHECNLDLVVSFSNNWASPHFKGAVGYIYLDNLILFSVADSLSQTRLW